ncbi:hypothetical protein FSG97_023020, partial [Escherichia coli]|nr:hypothetical protein [Escherichia coli]
WQPEFTDKTLSRKPGAVQIVKMVKASRGAGQFIFMTDRSDEELCEIAKQNILASRNKQLENVKLYLSRELQAMKELVSEYESQKKIAMQAEPPRESWRLNFLRKR